MLVSLLVYLLICLLACLNIYLLLYKKKQRKRLMLIIVVSQFKKNCLPLHWKSIPSSALHLYAYYQKNNKNI